MIYKLDKNNHAVFTLNFHLIICVKYRNKIFTDDKIIDRTKQIMKKVALDFETEILNQELDQDHIHILFKANPKTDLTKLINSLKGVSSRLLFREFPKIKKKLREGHLWSPSYCLITTGQVTLDQIKKYVESQGKKCNSHKR